MNPLIDASQEEPRKAVVSKPREKKGKEKETGNREEGEAAHSTRSTQSTQTTSQEDTDRRMPDPMRGLELWDTEEEGREDTEGKEITKQKYFSKIDNHAALKNLQTLHGKWLIYVQTMNNLFRRTRAHT